MGHKNIVPNIDPKGLGKLTSLWLQKCDYMECLVDTTGEKGPTAFSDLVKLRMRKMTWLKELCHGPPPISFLQKLKDVTIEHCTRLKVVFEMDGLLEKEEISQMPLLSNLTSLNLSFLPELESIWKSQSIHQYHASLRSLKVVNISWCDELKAIFPPCLAQSLLHLQELEIFECDRLEQVFDFPQEVGELEVRPLSNLTSLELKSLPELKWIWKGPTHLVNLQSLKTMIIWGCKQLAYLFSTPLARSLEHLEVLVVSHCDSLEHLIFDEAENEDEIVSNMNGYPLRWPKLRTLKIINCGRLKYVFPITLAQGLPYLESVEITDCSQLKQVFNMTEDKGGRPLQDIVLQRLQILRLKNLEKLSSFCLENFVISLSLKAFEVCNCPQLTEFTTLQAHLKDVPSYGFKELLCNVKELTMDGFMYHNLKHLFSPSLVQSLVMLEKLKIELCDELEHIATELEIDNNVESDGGLLHHPPWPKLTSLEIHGHIRSLQKLKDLTIRSCKRLKVVFEMDGLLGKEEISQTPLLSNLTSLDLSSLPELESIWKSQSTHQYHASLRSLKVVNISRCGELKAIFPPCLAQSLLHLKNLSICYCYGLEQIIDFPQEMGELQVRPLSNLTSLELKSLPELKWIWKGPTHLVNLQSLKTMIIWRCEQLDISFRLPCSKFEHLGVAPK
ncbi:uncharacterized protein LOC111291626 [Durio zibethinus]|uniref:Uncharacterized protein LOC111291626 n=1 Tax=Durio zibethinus TaxID=66656 RepID=A0A6P5YFJ7_DURZI|nr:uncharacterized protein LOC111291626 [Durio zibethinus]